MDELSSSMAFVNIIDGNLPKHHEDLEKMSDIWEGDDVSILISVENEERKFRGHYLTSKLFVKEKKTIRDYLIHPELYEWCKTKEYMTTVLFYFQYVCEDDGELYFRPEKVDNSRVYCIGCACEKLDYRTTLIKPVSFGIKFMHPRMAVWYKDAFGPICFGCNTKIDMEYF